MKVTYATMKRLQEINEGAVRTNRNRSLTPAFFESFSPETKFPMIFSMLHNDVEIRAGFSYGDGVVWIDMPFEDFNSLPEIEVQL